MVAIGEYKLTINLAKTLYNFIYFRSDTQIPMFTLENDPSQNNIIGHTNIWLCDHPHLTCIMRNSWNRKS